MSITIDTIRAAENEEALIGLLATELQLLLPIEIQKDREQFHQILATLPRGLRAMAGTHEFDVSMTQEALAMHIACQHDERDLRETVNGLRNRTWLSSTSSMSVSRICKNGFIRSARKTKSTL